MFQQTLSPTPTLWLTILVSLIPLAALLYMLAIRRMTAWIAAIIVGVITIPLGVGVWHAPLADTLKSYLYGGLTGIWVIDWITFWGLIIFNTLVLGPECSRASKTGWCITRQPTFASRPSCWPGPLAL